MTREPILEIRIDAQGRLCVIPESASFPHIYRECMEVGWDVGEKLLYSPAPREWTYARWFRQIVDAARAQGVELLLTERTRWVNVPIADKQEMLTPFN